MSALNGKNGLVLGVANDQSIAYGCARWFRQQGANIALTYQNDKAAPYVEPLAVELEASICQPCDVTNDSEVNDLFKELESHWGRLDFVLHSIAFAPREALHNTVTRSPRDGFLQAMDISCHSFARLAHRAEHLMASGGCLLTVSYFASQHVSRAYSVMGPVKAALESTAKYMAAELGEKAIRVNVLSPGPMQTRAASGIKDFDKLLEEVREKAPSKQLVSLDDVGAFAAFLVSDEARHITGGIHYIDSGYHIMD